MQKSAIFKILFRPNHMTDFKSDSIFGKFNFICRSNEIFDISTPSGVKTPLKFAAKKV